LALANKDILNMEFSLNNIKNTDLLLQKALKESLYNQLLKQLEKDFNRANLTISLENLSPLELKTELKKTILNLFLNDFSDLLSLLYIIDVSESKIKNINSTDLEQHSEQITFLILKREWQKIWFKNSLSQNL